MGGSNFDNARRPRLQFTRTRPIEKREVRRGGGPNLERGGLLPLCSRKLASSSNPRWLATVAAGILQASEAARRREQAAALQIGPAVSPNLPRQGFASGCRAG